MHTKPHAYYQYEKPNTHFLLTPVITVQSIVPILLSSRVMSLICRCPWFPICSARIGTYISIASVCREIVAILNDGSFWKPFYFVVIYVLPVMSSPSCYHHRRNLAYPWKWRLAVEKPLLRLPIDTKWPCGIDAWDCLYIPVCHAASFIMGELQTSCE